MWEDGEHRFARRTLYPPDGNPTKPDPGIMRMACETPAPATGDLVLELKAQGHDEGDDTFEERLPIAKQLEIRRLLRKSTVIVRFSRVGLAAVPMCDPQVIRCRELMRHHEGNVWPSQADREGLRTLPRNAMECAFFYCEAFVVTTGAATSGEGATAACGVARQGIPISGQ